ncbi:MCE family protein [Hoyosella rhizosphaerae]|uniref:ABC transporter substrate-binding protein n=1 Tax=Hoyosella rhizosphaerae TaxID=1755582 RepID=A0A916UMA4_9ACTN|nr:MlaD family protein [Hoyosella rhizosphaerae]MBN4925483.1 MCE family protein [Hoyosella rhizosphaerae]GGC77375.1 ABC transporter substrate-binding protein [Hoyosella rhizosphaerae]
MSANSTANRSRFVKPLAIVLAALLVITLIWFVFFNEKRKTVFAEFPVATGLYQDNEVRLLGVDIGRVVAIVPSEDRVRVEMEVDDSVHIPANVRAFITNRTLVADRYVELVLPPPADRVGEFASGDVIPLDRTDVPIDYDMLLTSAKDLADALAGEEDLGNVRRTLERMGSVFDGLGPEANRAIEEFAGATRVLANNSDEIDELLEVFGRISRLISDREVQIREFTSSLTLLAAEAGRQDNDLGAMISQIRVMFDEADRLVTERGGEITQVLQSTDTLANVLASRPVELAEIIDIAPLMGQNFQRGISDDGSARIRLNVSTDLQQVPGLAQLCGSAPAAFCTGAGFTNPIAYPIGLADPLNIGAILQNAAREGR